MLMAEALARVPGLTVFPSQGNFILVKVPGGWDGTELRDHLVSEHGVYVRECGNKLGMTSQFLRLVVRPFADVERLVDGMASYARSLHGTLAPAMPIIPALGGHRSRRPVSHSYSAVAAR
jgi:histidinol-phosphate/aromatic aminotransferase/cobyric acid decarboxylase-like protein